MEFQYTNKYLSNYQWFVTKNDLIHLLQHMLSLSYGFHNATSYMQMQQILNNVTFLFFFTDCFSFNI